MVTAAFLITKSPTFSSGNWLTRMGRAFVPMPRAYCAGIVTPETGFARELPIEHGQRRPRIHHKAARDAIDDRRDMEMAACNRQIDRRVSLFR